MSSGTCLAVALASGFTLGCIGIHRAHRHADAVTLILAMILGLMTTLVTARLGHLHTQHMAEAGQHPGSAHLMQ